jgi:pimeloyl-ACP methyl ester carboxylesterase
MIDANGLRFHVQDECDGPPVVLLHGFPDTSQLWRHQIRKLTEAGYRTIAPDLRGRGGTERPPRVEDYALRAIARDVTAIMDVLGLERAHVVGHDWGAAVAWLVAALEPSRVDRLVAISVGFPGAAGPPDLEALQKGWYRILFQLEGVAEDLLRQDNWHLMRTLLGAHPDVDQALRDLSEPGALTSGLNWYRANLPLRRLVGGGGTSLPPVRAPTLGIWSSGDDYLTEQAMTASGNYVTGGWRYERVERAGHWVPLDQPDRLNALLLEFLGGQSIA